MKKRGLNWRRDAEKFALAILAVCLLMVALSGCTSSSMQPTRNFTTITPGMLEVVTGSTNAPFVWINTSVSDPQERYTGFDVDLMREIAKELKCQVEFVSQPFSTIITSVQAGQYDCAIDSLSITGERQTRVAFSDPYYMAQQSILVRANDSSINNASDLVAKGKLICVQSGTTGEAAARNLPGVNPANIKSYERYNDMLTELQLGSVDAVIMDYPINQYYSDIYAGSFKFTGQLFPEKEPYAIVINKENVKLTAAIDRALANIKADGRYEALLNKYHLDATSAFSG
ncbi:MAG TPA: ABC transporter substrate-binding protein [Methanocella sp.]|uniref:ABC transporter substrate-binding protein n=1 Tax=Methanocella sp. TaxID=2052833 RepID=UPI002CA6AD95|nr:ABC transporter substrate-binding protein [Methanocella sp.]HTY90800.1 ABC transporter substrate-binding protein [Methanocella sp.]